MRRRDSNVGSEAGRRVRYLRVSEQHRRVKAQIILGNEEPSVVQHFPVQGTAEGCGQTAATVRTGSASVGRRSCEQLTVGHRLVLGDVWKEFVEGFVVFSETLLEKENKQQKPIIRT